MSFKNYVKLFTVVILLVPVVLNATNLRGQITGKHQYTTTPYPIGGAVVVLYKQVSDGWKQAGKYVTSSDGMYFFQNVSAGNYSIQVNGRKNYPIAVSNQTYQDLPPIIIKY